MAYVSKEKKAKIAAALKQVVPAGWKYSLAVRNHSTIVMTIRSAPIDLIRAIKPTRYFDPETVTHADINPYHYREQFGDEAVTEQLVRIFETLNTDNFDESDVMTDYFHVGHYVDVHLGKWGKPFEVRP